MCKYRLPWQVLNTVGVDPVKKTTPPSKISLINKNYQVLSVLNLLTAWNLTPPENVKVVDVNF